MERPKVVVGEFIILKGYAEDPGMEATILKEAKAPKRKSKGRSFVKKGKVFKNEANAKKRIRSKPVFGKTNQSAPSR